MRPVAGFSRYATPIAGLYLGGAGTHPGPGILGGPGWLAARRADRRPEAAGGGEEGIVTDFHRTVTTYRQGARTLPGECYTSPAILAEERERIHARGWNAIGRAALVASPGDFVTREIAGESIIVTRDREGVLRAFFNVCRHRGTRICMEESGRFHESIQCPYHAWTYGTDGRLIGAPHMHEAEGFDKSDYPLHQAAVAEWEGFVLVNVDRDPPPFDQAWAPMRDRFARFGLAGLVVGHRVRYDVRANWKLVFQNYSSACTARRSIPSSRPCCPTRAAPTIWSRARSSAATWRSRRRTRVRR